MSFLQQSSAPAGETSAAKTQAPEARPATAVGGPSTTAVSESVQAANFETQTFQTTELDLPESTWSILLLFAGLVALFGITIRTSLRDSRFLKRPARLVLLVPRLLLLLCVLLILLNPQRRTQLSRIEKSRVGIVVDTSLSMQWPAADSAASLNAGTTAGAATAAPPAGEENRTQAVIRSLVESGLLAELSQTHVVTLYTFDNGLAGPWAVVSNENVRFVQPEATSATAEPEQAASDNAGRSATVTLDTNTSPDAAALPDSATLSRWRELLQPRGSETRLGESVYQMIGQLSGRTLAGVVVLSDGGSNAGLEIEPARTRAERSGTKLISVGVGSLKPRMNLWIAGMQSPTDVHQGDPFDINVMMQGTSLQGQAATVRLFQQSSEGDGTDRRQIAEQTVTPENEALPTSIRFTQTLAVPGKYEFVARVEAAGGAVEMTLEDNERRRTVEVTDRKMRVLVISSGPMRDYQFVRNTLFRHSGVESDVWLQSVTDENAGMVSQESRRLLTGFPATEAELFEYDVVVAFDPDWSRLSSAQQTFLNRWVSEHAGGLVIVAGEIFTPRLAENADALREISVLYPVLLNRLAPAVQLSQGSEEPWPVLPTPEGRVTEFLKIAEESGTTSVDLWKKFKGIYRSYPIRGLRDGAVVLLQYDNPRARTDIGIPPFLVSQFYGAGRTLFLGSAETWRLREISPQGHQRFWTSLIREAGQGRRSRGTARGMLLLDRSEVNPGQAVTIRAQLYNAQLQPLAAQEVSITILDPDGQPVAVPDRLNSDGRGAGQFNVSFRPARPGTYRISVPVPESPDVLQTVLEVVLPSLESLNPVQSVEVLTNLTKDTRGQYLSLAEIGKLPSLLNDESQPVVVDEQLRTLWDRQWLMYLSVGLLAFEWIMRRLWRLS